MGTQKSLLLDLLETPWWQSSPVPSWRRLTCWPWRWEDPTKKPSAGPSVCPAHHQLLPKDVILFLLLLASCLGLPCSWPLPCLLLPSTI